MRELNLLAVFLLRKPKAFNFLPLFFLIFLSLSRLVPSSNLIGTRLLVVACSYF